MIYIAYLDEFGHVGPYASRGDLRRSLGQTPRLRGRFARSRAPSRRYAPYLSLGTALVRAEGARYVDGDDGGQAALYGGQGLFDAGAFKTGLCTHTLAMSLWFDL